MKLNNKGFTHILALAVIVIGAASIAYAAYAQVLTVSGTGTAVGEFDIAITSITPISKTGATDATAPSFTGTSATFDVDLAYPGATATYDITVTNAGTIPARLTSITDLTTINAAAPTYITFAHSGLTANVTTIAASGATNVLRVVVTWDASTSPDTTSTASKTATITLNYAQDT